MSILRGYGLGTNLQRLLHSFWGYQAVLLEAGRFYELPFITEIGVTRGDPVSPTTFNILVDVVVRAVMLEVCRSQEAHNKLGWV